MPLSRQVSTLQDNIAATTSTVLTGAGGYYRHTLLIATTGSWTFRVAGSTDAVTWDWLEAALTVDTTSDLITIAGNYPHLRLTSTRTGGNATVRMVQYDSHADGVR